MLLKKILLIGGGVVVGSTALASAIAIPISQFQLNSSSAEVPTDPNGNNQPNDQGGNNNQNEENNNNPQVPDTDNNGNSGENTNPNPDSNENNNLTKDVELPKSDVFFRNFGNKSVAKTESFGYQVYNKVISSDTQLNSTLNEWFSKNKDHENFNGEFFFILDEFIGLDHNGKKSYNYEKITYVDNSAKIITNIDSSNNQLTKFGKVFSLNVQLTPASGHAWTDGASTSKIFTVYGGYSNSSNSNN